VTAPSGPCPTTGFGAKGNSADFLLRLYLITPLWETADGGSGEIEVGRHISLRDPDRRIPFPIVHDATPERLLTGDDFDIESVVRRPDGSFWIGEEFGPFLLHVDATGKLLAAPVGLPDGKSPAHPFLAPGEEPRVRSSRGFEAMAASADGRHLYPIVEGSFADDPLLRRRYVYEFDTHHAAYTGRRWQYETDTDSNVIGDAFTVGRTACCSSSGRPRRLAAVTKRLYEVDLRRTEAGGFLEKELVVDLLDIANPDRIGVTSSPDAYGVDDPFSFPLVSVEVVVQLRDGRILVANDNNYPGNDARVGGTPDDTEMIVLDLRHVPAAGVHDDATVVGHRGASGYRPEHTLAAYELAILQCADHIEPDLVSTKDGVLVARHENDISGRPMSRPPGARRPAHDEGHRRHRDHGVVHRGPHARGAPHLRATSGSRPPGREHAFDGLYQVPTFDEVVDLARRSRTCDGDPVGVYPETKHPSYFDSIGLSLEERLLAVLAANDTTTARPRHHPELRDGEPARPGSEDEGADRPADRLLRGTVRPHVRRRSPAPTPTSSPRRARDIATYADGVGLCKAVMIPRDAAGNLLEPTGVIDHAHTAGLTVHGWTFRRENEFLPLQFRSGTDQSAPGDMAGELTVFLDAGMDGFFTDNPDVGAAAIAQRVR
jgi:glycerophosphoryl diester phosphodiesterase